MTGTNSYNSSPFSPGITENPFVSGSEGAKRWLTPGATPPGWISPGPSCTITNVKGQTVGSFVEIDGIARTTMSYETDCATSFDTVDGGSAVPPGHWCDNTFNLFDPVLVPNSFTSCPSSTDPTCYGKLHSEFDKDWMAAGYCGVSTTYCNNNTLSQQTTAGLDTSLIDVQGFIFWDPDHLTTQWHSFTGWELHPITAWRLHQGSKPDFTLAASPSSISTVPGATVTSTITVAGQNGFSGTISLSTSVSPGGPTTKLSTSAVKLSSGGAATSTLSFSAPTAGNHTVTVNGTNGTVTRSTFLQVNVRLVPDFLITPNPGFLSEVPGAAASSTITLTSLNGFSGPVSLSATVSAGGFGVQTNPSKPSLSSGGTSTATLTITAPNNALIENYLVTLTGKSGSITHTVTLPLAVTAFAVAINPGDVSLPSGGSGSFNITLASLNGFSGNVTLTDQVSNNNLIASLGSTTVQVPAGGSDLTVLGVSSSANGAYTVTVTGTFGKLVKKVSATVDVTSNPDFIMGANPIFLSLTQGSSGTSTIVATSANGLSSNLSLKATVNPAGPVVSLNPTSIKIVPSSPSTSTLTVSASSSVPPGLYSIVVSGASGSTHTVTVWLFVARPMPDFIISSNPTSQTVTAGGSASYILTLTSLDSFSGTITLSLASSQSGLVSSINPAIISLTSSASATSNLTITTTSSTAPAAYAIVVTANSSFLVHTTTLAIVVNGPTDFALVINPVSLTILANGSGNATVSLNNYNGFSGTVTLSTSTSPSTGLNCKLSQPNITGSQTSTLSCNGTTGSYSVTVTGRSGSLNHSATITLTVQDFSIAANPMNIGFASGGSGNTTITIAGIQGFNKVVNLSTTTSSPTITVTLNPSNLTGSGSSTLTVSGSSTGSFSVTVAGSSNGLSHNVTVTVNVGAAQDFQISLNPTFVVLFPGGTNNSLVSITGTAGFNDNVSLSATLPSGFSVLFSNNPVSAGSTSTVGIAAAESVAAGQYTIMITGTSGTLTHSATLLITVDAAPDFALSTSNGQLTVTAGGSNSTQVTVQSLNGFSGSVNLSTISSPSGPSATFDQPTVTVTSGGSATSTLTVSTSSSTSPGTYTITVTGTTGSVSHSVGFTFVVYRPASGSYTVTVSVPGLPSSLKTGIYVNGTLALTAAGGSTVSLNLQSGTANSVGVDPIVSQSNQTRYVATRGNVLVTGASSITFNYIAQYLLVDSVSPAAAATLTPATGSYWYNSSTIVSLTETLTSWHYFLDRWAVDGANVGAASSISVVMNAPHVVIAYFDGASWATYNLSSSAQRDFNVNDTIVVGAQVSSGVNTVSRTIVTILSPSNTVLVANATMTLVTGNSNYNYSYAYPVTNGAPGSYPYRIYVTWSNSKTLEYQNTFNLISVTTAARGPASVVPGTSYSLNFTESVLGNEAHNIVLYVDLPTGQTVTSVTVGGIAHSFASGTSPFTGYTRYSVNVGFLPKGGSAMVSMKISVALSGVTGQANIYYHTTWTTWQGFAYSEPLRTFQEIII